MYLEPAPLSLRICIEQVGARDVDRGDELVIGHTVCMHTIVPVIVQSEGYHWFTSALPTDSISVSYKHIHIGIGMYFDCMHINYSVVHSVQE